MEDRDRFTTAALENGLITAEQVDECLELIRLSGQAVPLEEVLVNRGYLTPAEVGLVRSILAGDNVSGKDTVVVPPEEAGLAPRAPARKDSAEGPPRRFGRYQILDRISQGGMGVIYKVRHPELDKTLALKVLLAGADATEDQLRRFQQEARATAALSHRNIVPVHDVGVEGGQPYYTMTFIDGEPLHRLLERERLGWRRSLEIAARLADALAHAHEQGIVHRDVKPANVILDRDGEPMLTDFGLAKDLNSQEQATRTGTSIGTPVYMSPEQASGRAREVGPRSDVYSLGAVLYEMVTLRPPYLDENPVRVMNQVVSEDPPRPRKLIPSLPADVETVCLTAMEKDPARRYRDARALAEDCRAALAGDPIRARPASISYVLVKRIRKHRAMVAAAAIATLAVAVGGGGMARRVLEDRAEVRRLLAAASAARDEGNMDGSRNLYNQVLGRDPDDPEALKALPQVKEALAQREQEERTLALAEAARLQDEARRNTDLEAMEGLLAELEVHALSETELENLSHRLTAMRGPHAVRRLVGALAEDSVQVRKVAVQSLGWMGDREAVVPLVELLQRPLPFHLRIDTLRALSWLGGPDAARALWKEQRTGDPYVRAEGATWFRDASETVLESLPAKPEGRDLFLRGCASYGRADFPAAVEDMQQALAGGVEPLEARLYLASALKLRGLDVREKVGRAQARGDLVRAIAVLGEAIALAPALPEPYLERAAVRFHLAVLDLAPEQLGQGRDRTLVALSMADLNAALEREPTHVRTLLARGVLRLATWDAEESRTDFRAAIALDPYSVHGHYMLGLAELECGRTRQALASLTAAIGEHPRHADAYGYRSEAFMAEGEVYSFLLDSAKAIDLGAKNSPHVAQFRAWAQMAQAAQASRALAGASAREDAEYRTAVRKARRARFLGDLAEADRLFSEGLDRKSSNWLQGMDREESRFERALVRIERGDHDGARHDLERLTRTAPLSPDVHYATGLLQLATGELDAAGETFGRVRQMTERRSWQAHVGLARVRLRQGDRDKALRNLEEAVRLGHPDPEALAQDAEFAALADEPRFRNVVKGPP
ncbi:MAG: protein kinase [Planctomycetes bacterium]|nr:protein kinase [Planctomycetota bacterium]